MSNSIHALDLPIQLFVVGTVLGMISALIWFARTGDLDYWPVHIALPSVVLFLAALLHTIVRAPC
jgi:hypothetical protein